MEQTPVVINGRKPSRHLSAQWGAPAKAT